MLKKEPNAPLMRKVDKGVGALSDYVIGGCSEKGSLHEENQDRFCITDQGDVILCDGMGGMEAGGEFAELTMHAAEKALAGGSATKEALCASSNAEGELVDSVDVIGGSSVCIATIGANRRFEASSAGDIVVFAFSENGIESVVMPDVDSDLRLKSFVGRLKCGDRICLHGGQTCKYRKEWHYIIMATDGVWKHVPSGDMKRICDRNGYNVQRSAKQIVRCAKRRGSHDDRSVVVIASDVRKELSYA